MLLTRAAFYFLEATKTMMPATVTIATKAMIANKTKLVNAIFETPPFNVLIV